MRIGEIETIVLRSYEYPNGGWVLVRLRTDDGVEGLGECFVPDHDSSGVFAAREVIDRSLRRVVMGRDVRDVAPIWEAMYAVCGRLYDRRGLAVHAMSGMDMAAHDAAAKTLGVPLCQYLGGRFRDRVRVYVSSVYVDPASPQAALGATRAYVTEGFTAIKYYGWPDFGADLRRDAALLRELGMAAGEGVELMLDLGRPQSLSEALRVARIIETSGVNVRWWEEPLCSSDHLDALCELSRRTDLAIAAGERELTAYALRELIVRRAVDVVQPDLSWAGGLTEGRRVAEMARLFGVPLVPHNWGTMVNFAASIHLVASMPEGFLCEYPITARTPEMAATRTPSPMMTELAAQPIRVESGHALVPKEPGLGIQLDEDAIARYRCD